jgi:hypothetical protein
MGGIFFSRFEKPLYLSAAALGILQFYPETDKRRFRISCHLPIKEEVMLASMLAFCIAAISVYWLIGLIAAILTGVVYFPRQLYAEQPFIMFFWYIKALIFYAAVAVIMLEISWKDRLKRGIMLAGFYCLISAPSYNASEFYLIPLILTALIFIPAVYYPALRFRKGGDL